MKQIQQKQRITKREKEREREGCWGREKENYNYG